MALETQVNQLTYPSYGEGRQKPFRLNKKGEIVVNDWLQQAVIDGHGYCFQNVTPDTTIASSETAYAATAPALYLGVPVGTTAFPFWINVSFEDTAGTDNHCFIVADNGELFASGGTTAGSALNNLRSDKGLTSTCTALNGETAIVATDPGVSERVLYHYVNPFADVATDPPRVIVWEPSPVPKLVGPACIMVYIYGSTAPNYEYSIQWVEFPTGTI